MQIQPKNKYKIKYNEEHFTVSDDEYELCIALKDLVKKIIRKLSPKSNADKAVDIFESYWDHEGEISKVQDEIKLTYPKPKSKTIKKMVKKWTKSCWMIRTSINKGVFETCSIPSHEK